MRGTSCSSRALLNVTHTTPVRQTYHHHQQRRRQCHFFEWSRKNYFTFGYLPPCCHILLLLLLLLNLGFCNARRVVYKPPTNGNLEYRNGIEYPEDPNNNADYYYDDDVVDKEDLSEVYINEKDTNVKKIRFVDPNSRSSMTRKLPRKMDRHKTDQRKKPSDDTQGMNLIGYQGDYYGSAKTLENNDVQKIGMSTRGLKSLAEQVADLILAEADKLYDSLENGPLRGKAVSSSESNEVALQSLAKAESEHYVLCNLNKQ